MGSMAWEMEAHLDANTIGPRVLLKTAVHFLSPTGSRPGFVSQEKSLEVKRQSPFPQQSRPAPLELPDWPGHLWAPSPSSTGFHGRAEA